MVDIKKLLKSEEKKARSINFVLGPELRAKVNKFQTKHRIKNTSGLFREILNEYFDKQEEISNGK